MNISANMLDEFISIYKDEFGEEIKRKEANEIASRLLILYERLARSMPVSSTDHPASDDRHRIGFRT
jgi:hypothetical protein